MGELIALLSSVMFGAGNTLIRKGSASSSSRSGAFVSVLLTFAISGLAFVATGLSRGWPAFSLEGTLWFMLSGLLIAFLGRLLLYLTIQHIGSVRSSAIKPLNPFFAVFAGFVLLGERITQPLWLGMALIFIGFVILVVQSLQIAPDFHSNPGRGSLTGYVYGIMAAVVYGLGMVFRKMGLVEMPDPYFGTMISAAFGIAVYLAMALFSGGYRQAVIHSFARFDLWMFLAGTAIAGGQTMHCVALQYIEVSRAAMILSLETIFTLFFSAWIFRTRENITPGTVMAAILSMAGAGIIAYFR